MIRTVIVMLVIAAVYGCATLKPSQGPVLRVEHAHLGGATLVAFSPDGKWLASGGHDGSVSVWHVPDGKRRFSARPHRGAVRGLAWLDDRTVVSAAEDGSIASWSATDGARIRGRKTVSVSAMVYDRDDGRLFTGHTDGVLRSYDARDLQERGHVALGSTVSALAFDSQHARLAGATRDGQLVLLDRSLRVVQHLHPPREVKGLAFAPDGNRLAGGAWFELLLWNLQTGKLSVRDTEHFGAIISMDFTPKGDEIATIGRYTDGGVRLVDAVDNHVVRRLLAHRACGWSVRVSPNGRYLATASEDESIRIYDLQAPYEPKFQHDP